MSNHFTKPIEHISQITTKLCSYASIIRNIAITKDGGNTWKTIGSGTNDGYKSCVQYVPNSGGKELVALGFSGISYSKDGGAHWKQLSDASFLSFRFLNDSVAYAGGRNHFAKLTFR